MGERRTTAAQPTGAAPVTVLCIITGLKIGGAEMMLLKLAGAIDRDRCRLHVVSLTNKDVLGNRFRQIGVPVTVLRFNEPLRLAGACFELIRLLRRERPHTVHTWMYHADLIGGIAARLCGVPSIIWGIRHTDLSPQANKRLTLLVVRICAILSRWIPDLITVNSLRARDAHVQAGYQAALMRVIPNGFDMDAFRPDEDARRRVRASLSLRPDTPVVGIVGRFHPQKNHIGFVEAMRAVHGARPDVHFVFAGEGMTSSNTQFVASLRQAGLCDVTHLLGIRTDMPALLASLDVLALPSIGEAFPNVVGEAMATGIPCVVTRTGDCARIVGDTGVVVEVGDMAGMAKGLLSLLGLPMEARKALGVRARARIEGNYGLGSIARLHEDLYGA